MRIGATSDVHILVKPLSERYLSLAEREEIALVSLQGHYVQEMGRRLERAASTVSRELRRNAATRGGGLEHRAITAQWNADRSARHPSQKKARGEGDWGLKSTWRQVVQFGSYLPLSL